METGETNLLAVPNPVESDGKGRFFKIIYGNQEVTNIIDVNQSILEKGFKAIEYSRKSESFLIEAARNFIRKTNFSELNESLEDEEISEETYNLTLDQNIDKYVVTLRDIGSPMDVVIIADLVEKIGYDLREFSTSEVAEMFSVKESQLVSHANLIKHQLK
jgi:hypothetical protein